MRCKHSWNGPFLMFSGIWILGRIWNRLFSHCFLLDSTYFCLFRNKVLNMFEFIINSIWCAIRLHCPHATSVISYNIFHRLCVPIHFHPLYTQNCWHLSRWTSPFQMCTLNSLKWFPCYFSFNGWSSSIWKCLIWFFKYWFCDSFTCHLLYVGTRPYMGGLRS